jgi:hypothetical protein
MAKFNNIPGQSAPKGDIKNKFKPDDTEYKGTKVIPYDASKSGIAKPIVANTTPKNTVDKDITNVSPRKSVIGANNVESTESKPAPVTKTITPVTKTITPVTKTIAKPVAKTAIPSTPYRGGRSEKDIQAMIDDANKSSGVSRDMPEMVRMADASRVADKSNLDRMRATQLQEDNPGMKRGGVVKKAYKAGGAVKSGASRGDGCAIRGRTKGKYC